MSSVVLWHNMSLSTLVISFDQSLQILSPDADQTTGLAKPDMGQGAVPDPTLHRAQADIQNSGCLRGGIQPGYLIGLIG